MIEGTPIHLADFVSLSEVKEVRDAFGLGENATAEQFMSRAYGMKFPYLVPGSGDEAALLVLQPRNSWGQPPIIMQWTQGRLAVVSWKLLP
jgi:hypothetical protein